MVPALYALYKKGGGGGGGGGDMVGYFYS